MPKQVGTTLFFSTEEAASRLGCSGNKIRSYIRQGRLKAIRQGQGRMVSEEDLYILETKRFF